MNTTIEEHPWELFPQDSRINRLIVGSFPPNKMVLPVGHNYENIKFILKWIITKIGYRR